jgi:Ca2+-binding RTX toxin-like protein
MRKAKKLFSSTSLAMIIAMLFSLICPSSVLADDFTGTAGNDTINGTANDDNIWGLGGNDTLNGNNGNDMVDGGANNDTMNGGDGDDTLIGGSGTDTINGGNGTDTVSQTVNASQTLTDTQLTGNGTDTLSSIEQAILTGGASNNTLNASAFSGNATLNGLGGNDTLTGGSGNDTLNGGDGIDTLTGNAGNDALNGEAGNDTLTGGSGNDTLTGGAGNDTYNFNTNSALGSDSIDESGGGTDAITFTGSTGAVTVNLGITGNQVINGNLTLNLTVDQIENVTGGNSNDTFTGNNLNNAIAGGTGTDTVQQTVDGTQTLTNALLTGLGNDTLNSIENAILSGGAGYDTINASAFTGTTTLNGLGGNDTLTGGTGIDTINGGDGDDILTGNNGNDIMNGENGNDTLNGGAGNDTINGGNGTDTVVQTVNANQTLTDAQLIGNGTDTLSSIEIAILTGGAGNNTLNASAFTGIAILYGLDGTDIITGGSGNDILDGGNGNDTLTGNAGNDTLTGGAGTDALTGGSGNDTYLFDTDTPLGTDTITESAAGGTDTLDFSGSSIDINLNLNTAGAQVVNANLTVNMIAASVGQIDNLTGGAGTDTLAGNALDNTLFGGGGNDVLTGNAGNDTLNGGDGNDTINTNGGADDVDGGTGDDIINFSGNGDGTSATGGTGSNIFRFLTGVVGHYLLNSQGTDTIDFSNFGTGIALDLNSSSDQDVGGGLFLQLANFFTNVIGTAFDDMISGNNLDNDLQGGAGNDTLIQTADSDQVLTDTTLSGQGNDTHSGFEQAIITGGAGNNTLDVSTYSNPAILNGMGGDDTLTGGLAGDTLNGGTGNDTLFNSVGNDHLDGGADTDTVIQSVDADQMLSDATLTGMGSDTLAGIEIALLTGGIGNNNLDASLFTGVAFLNGMGGDDLLSGGSGDDTLNGSSGNDALTGNAGSDVLDGEDGNDILNLNGGADIANGGAGDDSLILSGSAGGTTATAGSGTNLFSIQPGLSGNITLDAQGLDTLDFSAFNSGVTFSLGVATAQALAGGLNLAAGTNFTNLVGTAYDDVLTGNALGNTLRGMAGRDILNGAAGNDIMDGGSGTDTVTCANRNPGDILISIELPDCEPTPVPPPSTGSNYRSGELVALTCGMTTLVLPSGDYVRINHLCGNFTAVLTQKNAEDLVGLEGSTLRGMELKIYENGTPLESVPVGATITWSFTISADIDAAPKMSFFDTSLNQGSGDWMQVPARQVENGSVVPTPLHPDMDDGMLFYAGASLDPNHRLEVTTNFSGLMAISHP